MDRKAYEHLAELNRNVESTLAILQKFHGVSAATNEEILGISIEESDEPVDGANEESTRG
jgi:hypothetical protein